VQKIDEGLQYENDADGVTYRQHDERAAKKILTGVRCATASVRRFSKDLR
jgi:hypothetical protein